MNLVFLDIDGVLNNLGSVAALGSPSKHFDPVSVALVDKLCREADAQIVVSSSWRNGDTGRLISDLRRCGAECLTMHVIGETPRLRCERGKEIQAWLEQNGGPHDCYVIIDDDGDMLPGQPFVQTTFEDGFRFRHYQEALRHFVPDHPGTAGSSSRFRNV